MVDLLSLLTNEPGMLLSLGLFMLGQGMGLAKDKAKDKKEQKQLFDNNTVRKYLEWCRKKDHKELITEVNAKTERIIEIVSQIDSIETIISDIRSNLEKDFSDVKDILQNLSASIRKPVLSPIPLHCRNIKKRQLLFRDKDLELLKTHQGDQLVVGQPGVGKTFLVYSYALNCGAKFIISNDTDEVIAALSVSCPHIIIVDDAAEKKTLLERLMHFRMEIRKDFRIIAVCWPYEKDTVVSAMGLSDVDILHLGLISADNIVTLVRQEFGNADIRAENWLLQEIQQQAAGRPGLAIHLVELLLKDKNTRPLIEGTAHFDLLERAFHDLKKEDTSDLLAAFSVGGHHGMRMDDVAHVLGRDVLRVANNLKMLATGGIIHQNEGEYIETYPPSFRHALLIKEFLSGDAFSLVDVYKNLFDAAPSKKHALLTLVCAIAKGASIEKAWLISKVQEVDDSDVWRRLAWASEDWCIWVLENHHGETAVIAEACLKYIPKRIIPKLLDSAVGDSRPENSCPNCPGRIIDKWIAQGCLIDGETIERRRLLINTTKAWLENGGDHDVAWRCLAKCMRISWETFETAPGSGRSGTLTNGLVRFSEVEKVLFFWDELLEIAASYLPNDWTQLTNVLNEWIYPRLRGKTSEIDYIDLTKGAVEEFMRRILKVPNVPKRAIERWCIENGLLTEDEGDSDFLVFCPIEHYGENVDWHADQAKKRNAAHMLGRKWSTQKPSDVAILIKDMEYECSQLGITYPVYENEICEAVADLVAGHAEWLTAFYNDKLNPGALYPFLAKVVLEGNDCVDEWLDRLFQDERYVTQAIRITLAKDGLSEHTVLSAMKLIVGNAYWVEGPIFGESISNFWLDYLACEAAGELALIVALCDFDSASKRLLHKDREKWLDLFNRGIKGIKALSNHRFHDLGRLVDAIPEVRLTLITELMKSGHAYEWTANPKPYRELLASLTHDEKTMLLPLLKNIYANEFTAWMIADDLELYSELLGMDQLEEHHLMPLMGDPSSTGWQEKAQLALDSGYAPENVAGAVLGNQWSWIGSEATFWGGWLKKFENLKDSENQQMQDIAACGIKMCKVSITRAVAREQEEDVLGLDYGE